MKNDLAGKRSGYCAECASDMELKEVLPNDHEITARYQWVCKICRAWTHTTLPQLCDHGIISSPAHEAAIQQIEDAQRCERLRDLVAIGGDDMRVRNLIAMYRAKQIVSYEELLLQIIRALLADTESLRGGLHAALNMSARPFNVGADGVVTLVDAERVIDG